jgi:hypothetical protein
MAISFEVVTKRVRWLDPEPIDPIDFRPMELTICEPFPLDRDLRRISTMEITPEIIDQLQRGAPYPVRGSPDARKYAEGFSISLTEDLVDRAATPHAIHLTETEIPVDPFIDQTAKPLSSRRTSENRLLDEDLLEGAPSGT